MPNALCGNLRRSDLALCVRDAGHVGLHRNRTDTWSDAEGKGTPQRDIPDEMPVEFAEWATNIAHDLEHEFTEQQVIATALMACADLDRRAGKDGAGLQLITSLITATLDEERRKLN